MSDQVMERAAPPFAGREGLAAPPQIRKARLSPKRLGLAGAALLAGLGVGWYGYDWWTVGRFLESTDDAYVGGNVTAISPHVAGFVASIAVGDNEYVHAGQLLVRLDPRDFQAALGRSEAVVQARAATLASLHAKYILQQSAIRQATADLASRTAQAVFANQDAQRYASLAKTNAGSWQEAQKSLAADQVAQSAVVSSQAGVAAARQQLQVLDTEITEAGAAVAQAQSDLQTARLNLSYTEIRAPIDGYVGNRAARVGAYVSEGAYLLAVIPSHGLWVDANFKEDQLARMRPGQPVAVVADVLRGTVFHGHVLSLAPGTGAVFSVIPPENATGNFTKIVQRVPVRIALDDGDATLGTLRAGLSTTVTVETRAHAPSVP